MDNIFITNSKNSRLSLTRGQAILVPDRSCTIKWCKRLLRK